MYEQKVQTRGRKINSRDSKYSFGCISWNEAYRCHFSGKVMLLNTDLLDLNFS